MARKKPIYGLHGEIVGHSDTTGQGSKPSRAVREQKKPKPPPPATPPDQQDRRREARERNYQRGAAPTGGPGRAEVRRSNRIVTKAKRGTASTRDIQRELRRQGYDIALDGIWGPQTEYAWKQHVKGLATGQAGYQRDRYRRQQAYLKTALTAPPNYEVERDLFGEDGVMELERARQHLRGLQHQQRMAAFKAEEPSGSKGILGSIKEGAGRAKDFYQSAGETVGRVAWDIEKFNVEHLIDMVKRDPAGFAADPVGAFAKTPEAAELGAGPELASAVRGEDFDKRWAVFEAALIPFRPLGVLKGVLRGGIALRGGREAAKAGFKAGYKSPSIVREYTVGKHVARREAARSRTGRAIEKLSDRIGNEAVRAGKEQRYSTKFRMDLMEVSPQVLRSYKSRLRRVGRRVNDKQEYALRIVSEGMTPAERVAHHVALAQKSNLPHLQLYHLAHAGMSEEAGKFVQLNPEWKPGVDVREIPRIILKKDAPRHLHQTWDWFKETGALREGLLSELSRLSDESIMGRLHAPGRVIAGARFKKYEQAIREELEQDPARAQAFEWIEKNIQDPSEAQGLKVFYDYVIRSAAESTDTPVASILARISGVESKVKLEEIPDLHAFYSVAAPEAVHTPPILPFREIAERVIAAGHALPDDLKTPAKLARKLDEVYSYVREGADYKDWYKRAAAVTAATAKRLDLDPLTFAKVVGIMSQQAAPTENLRRAVVTVKMFQETGDIKGFLPGQAEKVKTVLQGGDWEGRKTNSYYANVIKYLEPHAGEEVTVDRHMARLFVPSDHPGKYYAGIEKIFQEMAGALGWAPEEVQAAAWVPIKARNIRATTLKRGKEAKDFEAYMPSAGDAYERGYVKYKGELFQLPYQGNEPGGVAARAIEALGGSDAERIAMIVKGEKPSAIILSPEEAARAEQLGLKVAHDPIPSKYGGDYFYVAKDEETLAATLRASSIIKGGNEVVGDALLGRLMGYSSRDIRSYLSEKWGAHIPQGVEFLTANEARALRGEAGTVYHGTSANNAEGILSEGVVRQADDGRGHVAAWFTEDPPAAAFRGDVVISLPRKLLGKTTVDRLGVVGVDRDVALSSAGKELFQKAREVEEVSSERGIAAINRAIAESPFAWSLTPHTPEELASSRIFLTAGDKAGFVISKDGELQNVFNNSGVKGLGDSLVGRAVREGATHLDAFDIGPLPALYERHGFVITERLPFDPQYAPESMPKEIMNKRPDVLIMRQEGAVVPDTLPPHVGFRAAAQEELDAYAALARDVADTLPENEWPQWVKNQMRDQGERVSRVAEDKPGELLQGMLREIDSIPDEELRNAVTKAFGDMVSDPSPSSLDEFGSWIQNKLFLEELQGTEELDALQRIHALLPPVKGVTREMHGLPEKSIVPREYELERQIKEAVENEDYETAQVLHNELTQGVQDELRSDIHRLPSGKFWIAGERKLFDTYGEAEAFKIPGVARETTEGELFQRGFPGADRLAELDDAYEAVMRKLEKAVNPYPPGLREQARRNRRGSRRSRMGQRTTNQDRRILAEQKLDELIASNPEKMKGISDMIAERDELVKARNEWQDSLFQKGGELRIVSPYGIKGAVSFNADDVAKIFLTEAADVTTLPHEMAHIMRRLMTPAQEKAVAKAMGAKLTGPKGARTYEWDEAAEEKFAKVWEGMILHGLEPPGAKREFAALSKAFSEVLADAEVPNVPFHVAKVLRRMTEFTPRPGGKIMGAEDVLYGVEYAPTFRGMPFRPTQAHRQLSAYVKKASLALFGGGKKTAIGAGPDDPHLKKAYMGAALLSGAFKRDVIDPKADSATLAIRMAAAGVARKALVDAGEEIPRFADDIAVVVDPHKVADREGLGRFWDRVSELGERKLDKKDLEGVNWDLIETARKQVLPEELEGKPIAQVAQEILDTERPIDNIVWVPREFVEASGLRYVPRAGRYQERALKKWMRRSGMTWDVVNDLVKAQILWLNPAYAPVQFIGNTVMNLMHQGPFAAVSGWKSILMLRKMELAERLTMDTAMGEGIGAAIRPSGAVFASAMDALHHYNSIASDVLPRRMAFLHEARRDGYKKLEDVGALLKAARQGDEQALQTLEQISRRARRSIVDFDRMSPFERDVVTRWIFFYPWLRSATNYSLDFVKDHPLQAAAIALMYEHYQAEQQNILGDHPYYSNLDVPIGTGTVGLKVPWSSVDISLSDAVGDKQWRDENNNPMVFKMRQALTQTTPLELGMSLKSFGQGAREGGLDVAGHLTPLPYAAGVAIFGYDPYEGREVKPGFLTFLNQLGFPTSGDTKSTAPIVDRFKQIFFTTPEERAKKNESALYPRERRHHVARVGLGSLAPTPYNTKEGQERARELKPTLERKTEELRLDAKEYGLEPPSKDVLEDLRVRTALDSGWRRLSDKERAKRAAAAYDERYGTDKMSAFVPKLKSDPQAKKFYEALRPKIYPWLLAYERLIDAHEEAALGG